MTDPNLTTPPPDFPSIDGYTDFQLLDFGGSADVYRATEPQFERFVAIKILRVHLSAGGAAEEFRRECRAIGMVGDHPNIVKVHSAGVTSDGRPFLAMSLMEGSYAKDLPTDGLSVEEVVRVGIALCGAVATAHASGVLHGDIKPENLLRSRYGNCVLADFGVSTVVARTTISPPGFTPQHAAPEVLRGDAPTQRSDVYSLASTLYQLSTGRGPFSGDRDLLEPMQKLVESSPSPMSVFAQRSGLAETLNRALERDPEQRTGSAVELGRELEQCADRLGIGVPPMELLKPAGTEDSPAEWSEESDGLAPGSGTSRGSAGSRTRLLTVAAIVVVAALGAGIWWASVGLAGDDPGESAEVMGQSVERTSVDWGGTAQEMLRSLEDRLAVQTDGLIDLPRPCVRSELARLNEETLLSLLDSGAGDPRNIGVISAAFEGCQVSETEVASLMVGGVLDQGSVAVSASHPECTRDRVASTTALDDLAVIALTPLEEKTIRERVVTDAVARAAMPCLPQEQLAAALKSSIDLHRSTAFKDMAPETFDLVLQCIDRHAGAGILGKIDSGDPVVQHLWTLLIDDSGFPPALRAAYNSVRADAALAQTALTGPLVVVPGKDGSPTELTERACAASDDDACYTASLPTSSDPTAPAIC